MASQALGQNLLVGCELGHYRIDEKIGAGGLGEVYRARDEHAIARDRCAHTRLLKRGRAILEIKPPMTAVHDPPGWEPD